MAIPASRLNADGSLRPFDTAEIAAMKVEAVGVRDGTSATHSRRLGSSTSQRKFRCAFDQLDNFLLYMLGAVVVFNDTSTGTPTDRLSRLLPQLLPNTDHMACTQLLEARPYKWAAPYTKEAESPPPFPEAAFAKWECDFLFENVPFDVIGDTGVTFEYQRYTERLPGQPAVEYLTPPGTGFGLQYTTNGAGDPQGKPIPFNVGRPQVKSVVRRKWHRIPKEAWKEGSTLYRRVFGDETTGDLGYIGTVNSNSIFGFPKGTLLLQAPEEEIVYDPAVDDFCFNITWVWEFTPQTHNALPWWDKANAAPDKTGVYRVSRDGVYYTDDVLPDFKSLFNSRNHKALFSVGAVS